MCIAGLGVMVYLSMIGEEMMVDNRSEFGWEVKEEHDDGCNALPCATVAPLPSRVITSRLAHCLLLSPTHALRGDQHAHISTSDAQMCPDYGHQVCRGPVARSRSKVGENNKANGHRVC
jgi:hypothetical protein